MTDTTTLGPPVGGLGHLKLHAPDEFKRCPYRDSVPVQFEHFSALNQAFQLATGWELTLQESVSSYLHRVKLGNPGYPAIAHLSIVDLSPLLPPGIPAVSRIYCEKLLEQFNLVIGQLGEAKRDNYGRVGEIQVSGRRFTELPSPGRIPGTVSGPEPIQLDQSDLKMSLEPSWPESIPKAAPGPLHGPPLGPLPANPGYQSSRFALTPLSVDSNRAACDWQVDAAGAARFLNVICKNGSKSSTRELIAARSTFQTECRHLSGNRETFDSIRQTINQFFDDTEQLFLLVGSIDPLTGTIRFVGDHPFRLNTTLTPAPQVIPLSAADVGLPASANSEYVMPLTSGQHATVCCWEQKVELNERQQLSDWMQGTARKLCGLQPDELVANFERRMSESIPGLSADPLLAFAISRS